MLKANQRELQIKENVTGDTVHVVEQEARRQHMAKKKSGDFF